MSVSHDYQYSVQVKSRFDILMNHDYNDEDPDLLLLRINSKQEKKSKSNTKVKTAKQSEVKTIAAKEVVLELPKVVEEVVKDEKVEDQVVEAVSAPIAKENTTRGRGSFRGRFDRRPYRIPLGSNEFNENVDNRPPAQPYYKPNEFAPRSHYWSNQGRPRGTFSQSRGRYNGHREFDRRSGSDQTGVKAVVKKDGHGTGNWGTMEDELEANTADSVMEKEKQDEIVEDVSQQVVEEEQKITEEKPRNLTLKEYKELQKTTKTKVQLSSKGSRQANDGKDVFADMIERHKAQPRIEHEIDVLDLQSAEHRKIDDEYTYNSQPISRGRARGGNFERGGRFNQDRRRGTRNFSRGSYSGDRGFGRPRENARFMPTSRGGRNFRSENQQDDIKNDMPPAPVMDSVVEFPSLS